MRFIKLTKDDKVVDVVKDPIFVEWQRQNGIFLVTDESVASGIVSRTGDYIYQFKPSLGRFKDSIVLSDITASEYEELLKALPESEYDQGYDQAVLDMIESGVE